MACPRLVVGGDLLLLVGDEPGLPLGAGDDAVYGLLHLGHVDLVLVVAGRKERGLVDEVGQVGAREPRGPPGERADLHVWAQGLAAGVDPEDLLPPGKVWPVDHDLPVETAWPEERGVEDVGAVGGGEHDYAALGVEAVHLDEELVERLLPLIVPAAEAGATLPADGVDLVHKDDAWRVLLGLLEEVAHAAGADADEHLDEVGAGDGEERHSGLSGDGARQERLARTRRPDEERAFGYTGAELLELLGRFEELFDLRELLDGLVGPGDVGEGDLGLVLGHPTRPALAEAHDPVSAALHGAHEQDEEQHDEQYGRQGAEQREPEARVLRVDRVRYVLLVELARHVGHLRVGVLELLGVSLTVGFQESLHRLVFVVDRQVVLVGLGEIGDERSCPGRPVFHCWEFSSSTSGLPRLNMFTRTTAKTMRMTKYSSPPLLKILPKASYLPRSASRTWELYYLRTEWDVLALSRSRRPRA